MELKEICINKECEYVRKCKVKGEGVICPVYKFSLTRKREVRANVYFPVRKCCSCNKYYLIVKEMAGDSIWGEICFNCLYEFKMKGYPVNQSDNYWDKNKWWKEYKKNLEVAKAWDITDK